MIDDYKTHLTQLGFKPRKDAFYHSITEGDIEQLEAKLGYPIPKDYRQFLKQSQSIVSTEEDLYFLFDGEEKKEEALFIILLGPGNDKDLAAQYDALRQIFDSDENYTIETYPGVRLLRDIETSSPDVGWPEELLPIGVTSSGNQICIAFKGLRPGAIFMWRANPWSDLQNLYFVADSFDEFINSLHKCED